MHVTSKKSVLDPDKARECACLSDDLEMDGETDAALAEPERLKTLSRGEPAVTQLLGSGDIKMSTEAIMALTRGE